MYYTITISHSYSLSDYFKPEKKITGKNSYRSYDIEENASKSLTSLISYYKNYVEKISNKEVIMLNFTTHNYPSSKTEIYYIYWKNKQVCMLEFEL